MMNTVWAVVREGRIVTLENIEVPEGTRVLVTMLPEDDSSFWSATSESSLGAAWSKREDDVYAELLEE